MATIRPWGQPVQFFVSAPTCKWAESPAQAWGITAAASCAVLQQLLCLFPWAILVQDQVFFWVISEDVEVRRRHDPKQRSSEESLETVYGCFWSGAMLMHGWDLGCVPKTRRRGTQRNM